MSQYQAVVPPHNALESRDVLQANRHLSLRSPHSFGLEINRVSKSRQAESYPLYYVSPRAAADRSPSVSPRNTPGVHAGWYVVAEPEEQFELKFSFFCRDLFMNSIMATDDVVLLKAIVDGTVTSNVVLQQWKGPDVSFLGFKQSKYTNPSTGKQKRTLRRFAFCKSATNTDIETAVQNEGTGSIRVEVKTAKNGAKKKRSECDKKYLLEESKAVGEKVAKKSGISIGVRRDGETISKEHSSHGFHLHSKSLVADITIFMRERFWMQSRRIIDEAGLPVKYVERTFSNVIVELDNSDHEGNNERKAKGKRKTPKEIIDLEFSDCEYVKPICSKCARRKVKRERRLVKTEGCEVMNSGMDMKEGDVKPSIQGSGRHLKSDVEVISLL